MQKVVAGQRVIRLEKQQGGRDAKVHVQLAMIVAEIVVGVPRRPPIRLRFHWIVRVGQLGEPGRQLPFQVELAGVEPLNEQIVIRVFGARAP